MAKVKNKLFSRKFRNWLLYLVVSRQDLKSITGYTLQALKQDGDQWQEKIALLQPFYDSFDTKLTATAGAKAGQGSQTMLAETAFSLVKQFMKRTYKLHFAALEETAPELFKKFFPEGRSQFSQASRQTLGTAFAAFVQTLTDNINAIPQGAGLLKEASSLADQYTIARQEQDQRKKQVKTAGTALDTDETDILTELFGVYAALLAFYYKTPERVADYFDFSVLPPSRRQSEADDAAPTAA
ncbi:hypothetical protein [Hymenobacter terrenus]|uniref:hypothetical protein n=1 Tax=Hymenobacter terrenus TaxID=1629124 RepID=UPI0006192F98|nr:hypothetical protein [Hymenobacter terrenus]